MRNYSPCAQPSLTAELKHGFYRPSPTQSVMAVWMEPRPVVCLGPADTVMSEGYGSALASYCRIKEVLLRKCPITAGRVEKSPEHLSAAASKINKDSTATANKSHVKDCRQQRI